MHKDIFKRKGNDRRWYTCYIYGNKEVNNAGLCYYSFRSRIDDFELFCRLESIRVACFFSMYGSYRCQFDLSVRILVPICGINFPIFFNEKEVCIINQTAGQVNTDGNTLITDPNIEAPGVSVNETSTNNTYDSVQPETLADEEMESIKGQQLSVSAPVTSSMKLSAETMQSIRGRAIWKVAAAGAFFGVGTYILNLLHNSYIYP